MTYFKYWHESPDKLSCSVIAIYLVSLGTRSNINAMISAHFTFGTKAFDLSKSKHSDKSWAIPSCTDESKLIPQE
jgi:hypothetical protein